MRLLGRLQWLLLQGRSARQHLLCLLLVVPARAQSLLREGQLLQALMLMVLQQLWLAGGGAGVLPPLRLLLPQLLTPLLPLPLVMQAAPPPSLPLSLGPEEAGGAAQQEMSRWTSVS